MDHKPVPVEVRKITVELEIPKDTTPEDRKAVIDHLTAGDLALTSGLDYCVLDSWWVKD